MDGRCLAVTLGAINAVQQQLHGQMLRLHAAQRVEPSHQYMIDPTVRPSLLKADDVLRLFNHQHLRGVATRI